MGSQIDPEKFADEQRKQTDEATKLVISLIVFELNRLKPELKLIFSKYNANFFEKANAKQIKSIISKVHRVQKGIYDKISEILSQQLETFYLYIHHREESYFAKLIKSVGHLDKLPEILKKPIYANGMTIKETIDNLAEYEKKRMFGIIRKAWSQNTDISDLEKAIYGNAHSRYRDGYIFKTRLTASAAIDLAMTHVSVHTKNVVMQAAGIDKYQIVATLDRRTTDICRKLDHKIYKVGEGIYPPFHWKCRTVIVEVLDDGFEWLSKGRKRASEFGYVDGMPYTEFYKKFGSKMAM